MFNSLRALSLPIVDGENTPLLCDVAYAVGNEGVEHTITQIKQAHGDDICLLPISAASGGGGVFQVAKPDQGKIIGLRFNACPTPRVRLGQSDNIVDTSADEVIIDVDNHRVVAGSAVTLDQLNKALAEHLDGSYKVLGADLTSYSYAQVGATFMTGGMGPQRRYFSSSVDLIALYDGDHIREIKDAGLNAYAGTYGWSGIVTAVRCRFCKIPENEIAFAIPVSNQPPELARLLSRLSPFTQLEINDNRILTTNGSDSMIFGLEHITTAAMAPMFDYFGDNPVARRAKQLLEKCQAADADGLIFVNGFSNLSTDEFLFELVDDSDADSLQIGGVKLEHTQLFNNPEQMREVREAVPFAARTQAPKGQFIYKGHTDATVRLNPDQVAQAMQALWQANGEYISHIEHYFAQHPQIRGQILIYGHLNPAGVDPHNRLTFACDDATAFEAAKKFVHDARDKFYRRLDTICHETGSLFIGGEKGAGSEFEMFSAFGAATNLPPAMQAKYKMQIAAIAGAHTMFNWRAIAPYKPSSQTQ